MFTFVAQSASRFVTFPENFSTQFVFLVSLLHNISFIFYYGFSGGICDTVQNSYPFSRNQSMMSGRACAVVLVALASAPRRCFAPSPRQ